MSKWLQDQLEEIPCDFCGTNEASYRIVRSDGMQVVECARCGLAYLNPRPKKELIPKFYEQDYFTGTSADRGEGGLKLNLQTNRMECAVSTDFLRRLEIIGEKIGNLKGKDVFEVGCATGDFLILVKALGARARGLEISEFAADIARKRSLDVITGSIEEYLRNGQTESSFDILVAFELIEHVLSPTQFLNNAALLIRDDGFLIISTPNFGCANRFGKDWHGFKTSFEHIYFFSLDVLKRMSFKSGFVLKYWETSMWHGGPQQKYDYVELQKKRLFKLAFLLNEYSLSKALKMFLKKETGYYPYGTGHNLFMIFQKNRDMNKVAR